MVATQMVGSGADVLEENELKISKPKSLNEITGKLNSTPYVCTGDDAFPFLYI